MPCICTIEPESPWAPEGLSSRAVAAPSAGNFCIRFDRLHTKPDRRDCASAVMYINSLGTTYSMHFSLSNKQAHIYMFAFRSRQHQMRDATSYSVAYLLYLPHRQMLGQLQQFFNQVHDAIEGLGCIRSYN